MQSVPMSPKVKPLAGMRFGRLTVISYAGRIDGRSSVCWNCVCDCGKTHIANGSEMKRGRVQSCGCYASERVSARAKLINKTHGDTQSVIYSVWKNMRQRCSNPTNRDYHSYGGRGITVCDRWNDFALFKLDMGNRPKGCTIDRIDVNKGYSKENCRWSTVIQQARNKRTNRPYTYNGKTMLLSGWSLVTGIKEGTLLMRISRGWSIQDALTLKLKEKQKCKS